MELSFNKIKEIITGAVRIEEENGLIKLYRFTKEQEELYRITNEDFYLKSLSAAGVKLLFKTNSKSLFIKGITEKGSSRKYFSIDVFVDGKPFGYIDNFSDIDLPHDYTLIEVPKGEFSGKFEFGPGEKTVCIYLPWSVSTSIEKIVVDDNSFVAGVKPKKKLLAFGDSITQGYDALRPSNAYIVKLAEKLDAELYNKAIGKECFCPDLARLKDLFTPDYITVAYGTNDWNFKDEKSFKIRCKEFFAELRRTYPESKIIAITPIWRGDMNEKREFGAFETVEGCIKDVVKNLPNATSVSGFDFVPKSEKYFADLRLHPNDEGFEYYFQSLSDKLRTEL